MPLSFAQRIEQFVVAEADHFLARGGCRCRFGGEGRRFGLSAIGGIGGGGTIGRLIVVVRGQGRRDFAAGFAPPSATVDGFRRSSRH